MNTVADALRFAVLKLIKDVQTENESSAVSLYGLCSLLDDAGWSLSMHALYKYLEDYESKGLLVIQTYKGVAYPHFTVMITDKGIADMRRLSS